ncbi:MAG TPA: hypothetical protein GXZ23_00725 [Clostridiales bacterium]|jgi:hypothetical protein|nr:hypothetical protein [Clostridiales bacterium]
MYEELRRARKMLMDEIKAEKGISVRKIFKLIALTEISKEMANYSI